MKHVDIAVLGGGISGLSLGYFLREKSCSVFEASGHVGGLATTYSCGGFSFDLGGHFLHLRTQKIWDIFEDVLKQLALHAYVRKSGVYIKKKCIPYPYQSLYPARRGRPHGRKKVYPAHFLAWLRQNFHANIVREFMVPYNHKFWQVPLSQLHTLWAKSFIPVSCNTAGQPHTYVGYNRTFYYPEGGIGRLPEALQLLLGERVHTRKKVVEVQLGKKIITFEDGSTVRYRRLISTIPLPEFLICAGLMTPARQSLIRSTTTMILNCAVETDFLSDWHWLYFPEPSRTFYRIGTYSPFLPSPKKKEGTFYAEISIPENCAPSEYTAQAMRDLRSISFFKSRKKPVVLDERKLTCAYPIPYVQTVPMVRRLQKELALASVWFLGRFGAWQYLSMEDCILQAHGLAEQISANA